MDFEDIYTMYQPKVLRYLTRLVGLKEAEDITQEVFIKVSKALSSFEERAQVSTWIFQIANNAAIDRSRSRSYQQENFEKFSLAETNLNASNIRTGKRQRPIEEQIERAEMNEHIREYIEFLPEQYRTVIVLSDMAGYKDSEIAQILGLSIGAVRTRLHRARASLKKILIENCSFFRTECCGRLVCEPKAPSVKRI